MLLSTDVWMPHATGFQLEKHRPERPKIPGAESVPQRLKLQTEHGH